MQDFSVVLLVLYITSVQGDGGCKVLDFLDCVKNKTFIDHVIKSYKISVPGLTACKHKCYIEDKCVSYNLGPVEGMERSCELNDADHVSHPGHVVSKGAFEYCPIKNPCSSSPCPASRLCTPDFRSNSYNCDDGGWTPWSPWSNCNPSVCPYTRTRNCTNPPPQNNGANCTGPGIETKKCIIPVPAPHGCDSPLGMESGNISDLQITASSVYLSRPKNAPSHGRLNEQVSTDSMGGWFAGSKSSGEYLQVDLSSVKMITGVATQGRPDYAQWVTKYTVSYSNDTSSWINYEGDCNQHFAANFDRSTIVKIKLHIPVVARYIRIVVQQWKDHPSMRMELYGCSLV